MRQVFFDWGVSDHYGWGIFGYNLLLQGLLQKRIRPMPLRFPMRFYLPPDPIEKPLLEQYQQVVQGEITCSPTDVVLRAHGNAPFACTPTEPQINQLSVTYFETNPLSAEALDALRSYPAVIVGSKWNQRLLTEQGLQVYLSHEGVDPELFHYRAKRLYTDRFVVFSGGQLCLRKGQDIALKAFSLFAEKHDDALLLACWHAPWEQTIAVGVNCATVAAPLTCDDQDKPKLQQWCEDNGLRPDQYRLLDPVPNGYLPQVLREVDVALFPNRAEGGTNRVAMECLASAIPSLLSQNTGHLDLMSHPQAIALTQQGQCAWDGCPSVDWGESSLEEIVCRLEDAYSGRYCHTPQERLAPLVSWDCSITRLADILDEVYPEHADRVSPSYRNALEPAVPHQARIGVV